MSLAHFIAKRSMPKHAFSGVSRLANTAQEGGPYRPTRQLFFFGRRAASRPMPSACRRYGRRHACASKRRGCAAGRRHHMPFIGRRHRAFSSDISRRAVVASYRAQEPFRYDSRLLLTPMVLATCAMISGSPAFRCHTPPKMRHFIGRPASSFMSYFQCR